MGIAGSSAVHVLLDRLLKEAGGVQFSAGSGLHPEERLQRQRLLDPEAHVIDAQHVAGHKAATILIKGKTAVRTMANLR